MFGLPNGDWSDRFTIGHDSEIRDREILQQKIDNECYTFITHLLSNSEYNLSVCQAFDMVKNFITRDDER